MARSSECLGLAPPLPATKTLKPLSVAMRPKLADSCQTVSFPVSFFSSWSGQETFAVKLKKN